MAENIISPIDIYYKASKNENFNVQTNVPIELQQDLMHKKIAVKNFYLENTAVPMFIPAWLNGDNVRQISYEVGNYSSINSTKNINSLGYTVSLTTKDDNFGVDCFIIHQSNDYNSPTPLDYPSSEEYFDTNKYYWYKTFDRFLKNLASQIVVGINQLNTNASITPSDAVIFEFAVTSDNYIQMTVNEETLTNI